LQREAEAFKARGQLERATKLYEDLLAKTRARARRHGLVSLYISQRRYDDAVKRVERTLKLWPRNAALLRLLGDIHEHAGTPSSRSRHARSRCCSMARPLRVAPSSA